MKHRQCILITSIFLLSVHAAMAQGTISPQQPAADDLQQQLLQMGTEDQKLRSELVALDKDQSPEAQARKKALWAEQTARDQANMKRLEAIVKEHGWPGISQVGLQASIAAFLILQHAELSEQEKYLPMLQAAAKNNEARPDMVAMLEDRVLMREGKKQLYGTQLKIDQTGKAELWPIEDEANVDARRAKVGLMPLAIYLKRFGIDYAPPKKNP